MQGRNMSVPVFMYMGMLEGGKTSAIRALIESTTAYGETLLIQCEDGPVRLDDGYLAAHSIRRVFILDTREYTRQRLSAITEEYGPARILLECNGIWPLRTYIREQPREWATASAEMYADAEEFARQYTAMDRLIAEKLHFCGKICFHGTAAEDKDVLYSIVHRHNRGMDVVFR